MTENTSWVNTYFYISLLFLDKPEKKLPNLIYIFTFKKKPQMPGIIELGKYIGVGFD